MTEPQAGSIVLRNMLTGTLERASLETLTYSDIFEYPLRLDELHRYLPIRAEVAELPHALKFLHGQIESKDGFYFLSGREEIVELRKARTARSQKLLPHALRFGRMLGALPFVRMVALTGSLAVLNVSKNADFDYLLVTAKGRVWTARAFALVLNRFARLFGHTLCPNLILSESALAWPLHDLYSARELCQMLPITGVEVYQRLLAANPWAEEFLPNAYLECGSLRPQVRRQGIALQSFGEFLLGGELGDRLEQWEMTRKIARFSQQPGFGDETIFTAEVCQGNFHHHRKWTHAAFQERLNNIPAPAAVLGGEVFENPSPRTAMGAYE